MKIFPQRLYENILTVTTILSKPEMIVQGIQVKPGTPKIWLYLHSLLRSYSKFFYKFVTYSTFDNNYNINTWNIRRQVIGCIMSLERKRKLNLKANNCEEDKYRLIFNNLLTSNSILLQFNTHKEYCVLNTTDYNYKLRSVIGREDESKVTKWTRFNKKLRDTFLCS